jgi:hypothetical protein
VGQLAPHEAAGEGVFVVKEEGAKAWVHVLEAEDVTPGIEGEMLYYLKYDLWRYGRRD